MGCHTPPCFKSVPHPWSVLSLSLLYKFPYEPSIYIKITEMKPLPWKTGVLGMWAKSVDESALLESYWPHPCQEILGNEAILMREKSLVCVVRHKDDVKCSSWTVSLRVRILAEQEKPKSQRNQILNYEQTETVNHVLKVRTHSWIW